MNFFLKNNLIKVPLSSGFALTSGIFWALAVLTVSATAVYFSQQPNPNNLNTNLSINQIPRNNPPQPSLAPREGAEDSSLASEETEYSSNSQEEDSSNTSSEENDSSGTSNEENSFNNNTASTAGIQTESDPIFTLWNKQEGIKIKESQIKDLQSYLTDISGLNISSLTNDSNYLTSYTESDPIFSASEAFNFTQGDKTKLDGLNNYTLPTATADTLGGIKIGARLSITNGVLSADIQSGSGLVDSVNGQTGIVTLDPDDFDDTSTAHKFVSASQLSNWNTAYSWGNHSGLYLALTGTATNSNLLENHSASYFQTALGFTPYNSTNPAGYITDGNTNWDNSYGFLTSYTETDPVFLAWDKSTGISITESQISNLQSYLTSYTETDPVFLASQAHNITASHITILGNTSNTNTGDETQSSIQTKLGTATTTTSGYLTSTDWNIFNSKQPAGAYLTAETDPIFNIHSASSITSDDITDWTTAHSWGDHSASGYLTSYTETDPTFTSSQANNITASHITILGNTSNTNTGDETQSSIKTKLTVADTDTDGYLSFTDWNIFNSKQSAGSYLTSYSETDPIFASSQANNITATHINTLNNTSGTNTGDQSASDILTALKTVDGSTSGIDADLLDGYDSSAFGNATAANQATILSQIGTNVDSASMDSTLFAGQEELSQTLGTNDDNNTFNSDEVLANENGSVLERQEFAQDQTGGLSPNQGMYSNRIILMTPAVAYTEVCFKSGATSYDYHSSSASTSGGNCVPGDVGFIVEKEERTASYWELAKEICLRNNMRLAEPFEWKLTCKNASTWSVNSMTGNWEWASNFALPMYAGSNDGVGSAIAGNSGCSYFDWGWVGYGTGTESSYSFRCFR